MAISIDRDVPVPQRVTKTYLPFGDMQVGESCVVSAADLERAAGNYSYHARVYHKRFSRRRQADGTYRIWRVE